jgi:hypothetical protein
MNVRLRFPQGPALHYKEHLGALDRNFGDFTPVGDDLLVSDQCMRNIVRKRSVESDRTLTNVKRAWTAAREPLTTFIPTNSFATPTASFV